MSRLGIPEATILTIIILCFVVIWAVSKSKQDKLGRKCLSCGYEGAMKTWLSGYNLPKFISIFLLLCYIIPGLIFIAWAWGKYKCPICGALAKNIPIDKMPAITSNQEMKKCKFCAEDIKREAIKCHYCGSELNRWE